MATPYKSAADREMMIAFRGAPAPPLEDDNILSKILVRLPPLPSSLPRVSAVCKRWRRLVTQPHFHRSFLAHHKKAPLLGFFCIDKSYYYDNGRIGFKPALDRPNRMPAARFSSCLLGQHNYLILGCNHGRLLAINLTSNPDYVVVWDPITGDRRHIEIPQMFGNMIFQWKGAVVCASQEKDHIHGACHSQPFQVVLIGCNTDGVLASVYSSETCTWGNLISLLQPQLVIDMLYDTTVSADCQGSLVGNSVYWVPVGLRGDVLEFDLHRQSLAVIDKPLDASNIISSVNPDRQYFILPAEGGGLRFIVLSHGIVHIWKRISNGHGVAGWLFETTVDLTNLLSLKPRFYWIDKPETLFIVGRDEYDNMIFKLSGTGTIYLVHLKTLQFKELSEKIGN